nr:MAG TPA: hypothetical protein [Caudoviricetes sp.]
MSDNARTERSDNSDFSYCYFSHFKFALEVIGEHCSPLLM